MPEAREQEIASEQRVVDRVYERVDAMRARARVLAREGHARATAGPPSSLVERDALVLHAAEQLRALDAEAEGLVFGRLDFDDGQTYHIGRLGLRDDNLEPLLVDWRAPVAAAFYRATPGEPLGVVRRRVIICRGQRVVDLDDDLLTPDAAGDLCVLGEGALLAALRRARGPHLRDIVTTIQREQDEAIRAPVRGVTLITGGPGTGKTQVALHRAAYLLYTDRDRFADGRILVVGPSTMRARRRAFSRTTAVGAHFIVSATVNRFWNSGSGMRVLPREIPAQQGGECPPATGEPGLDGVNRDARLCCHVSDGQIEQVVQCDCFTL